MTAPLLVVLDDARARRFAPFGQARAWSTMIYGALPIHDRWAHVFPEHSVRIVGAPWVQGLLDAECPPAAPRELPAGTIVAHARVAATLQPAAMGDVWTVNGEVAAVRLTTPISTVALGSTALATLARADVVRVPLEGRWIEAIWDLIADLPSALAHDLRLLIPGIPRATSTRAEVIGDHPVAIEAGAVIEPCVVIDARGGPVLIRRGAQVAAFTRIAGPCSIGPDTHVLGGRVSGSAIGAQCRIHGDVSASIFAGYANKAHEGFVGHSIVGRWANLGAGTTTSNLKNSYGTVRVWTPDGDCDTGLTFLGALIGDHVKLGIGTMLSTGSVIGTGANVFGASRPPTYVRDFAWGEQAPFTTVERGKFIEVAGRVMSRRGVSVTPELCVALERLYDARIAGGG